MSRILQSRDKVSKGLYPGAIARSKYFDRMRRFTVSPCISVPLNYNDKIRYCCANGNNNRFCTYCRGCAVRCRILLRICISVHTRPYRRSLKYSRGRPARWNSLPDLHGRLRCPEQSIRPSYTAYLEIKLFCPTLLLTDQRYREFELYVKIIWK